MVGWWWVWRSRAPHVRGACGAPEQNVTLLCAGLLAENSLGALVIALIFVAVFVGYVSAKKMALVD